MMDLSFGFFLEQMAANPALLITVLLTLGVIAVNGITDAPNAIATCVSTRSMDVDWAIAMAAVCNFAGVVFMTMVNSTVAMTISNMVDFGSDSHTALIALCAALYAALFALRSPVYELADGAETGVMATRALVRLFDTARYAVLACAVICASVALRHGREKSAAQEDR